MVERGWLALAGVLLLGSCAAWGLAARAEPNAARPSGAHPTAAAPREIVHADAPATPPPGCPLEMAQVNDACVDRYEAHLLERLEDGSLVPHPPEQRPSGGHWVADARAGVKPQAYISQVEAATACENAGKRLCTLSEWHRACTGSGRATYPYGATFEAGRCNVGKNHLLSMLHGSSPQAWGYRDFNDPELDRRPGFLALTGEYAGCVSPDGAYDMVGNLHEWVADRVDRSLPKKLPVSPVIARRIGRQTGNGIFMGGFFSTLSQHGDGCNFVTAAHDIRYHDYSTGFRCCRDR